MIQKSFKWNFGFPSLVQEWKQLLTSRGLREDLLAGITVGCVAIPLSLAIALACGVSPALGLITSIVTGITCALFGGTPLAVSGPTASMVVLIASVVEKHGLGGLLIATIGCGLLQIAAGFFRVGNYVKLIPVPVVAGFTAGIGAIIVIGQYPRALGLPPPDPSHICDVFTHVGEIFSQANYVALALALATLALAISLPKISQKIPGPLIAVAVPSMVAYLLGLNIEKVGALPKSIPIPSMPSIPLDAWLSLATSTVLFWILASLETLLSSSAIDKLAPGKKHDPDQELLGQGLGNCFAAILGGIPATGVIARSALNVHCGAKTRRAAIIHSLLIILAVSLFSGVVSEIPISVLAGMLIAVALRMFHPREFKQLWTASRSDAFVYLITFVVIVSVNLIVGVQAGVIAALLVLAVRAGQGQSTVSLSPDQGPHRLSFQGALNFLSVNKMDGIRKSFKEVDITKGVVVDLSETSSLDSTGCEQLLELAEEIKSRNGHIAILGASKKNQAQLALFDKKGVLKNTFSETESGLSSILQLADNTRPINRLRHGLELHRKQRSRYAPLFERLGEQQRPHTLFITCVDSRIDPALITSARPGELLILRNVGNIIPQSSQADGLSEAAAIEFAVEKLGVSEIIVCGHSGCGAIQAMLDVPTMNSLPRVGSWLGRTAKCFSSINQVPTADAVARANIKHQLEHLKTYDCVRTRFERGTLGLHGWFYDISKSEIEELLELHASTE